MKSLTLIVSVILVLSISNIEAAPHNNTKENPEKQHIFLVKTDLTKEQVELLLNQYHQNKNQHQNQGEKTNLKNQAPEVPEPPEAPEAPEALEAPEAPEKPEVENENETETVSLKKGNKKKEKPKKPEDIEVPEAPEVEKKNETEEIDLKKGGIEKEKEKEKVKRIGVQQAPDSSDTTGGNNNQSITINFKKKGNDKKEKTEKPQTHESSEVTEVPEVENKTNLLVNEPLDEESKQPENETETEIETENEIEEDTIILANKNNTKQSGSRVMGFISAIILTICFVSFFIYVTQPKKTNKKNKNSFNELSYYLKVKGN